MGVNASKNTAEHPQVPSNWGAEHIPSQWGKTAVVTGANSGIGYEMALELARKGAHVVLACRSEERGLQAQTSIQQVLATTLGAGSVELMLVDMGDLASVRNFCEEFKKKHERLDLLMNNAGIFGGGPYSETVDGYEQVFAINYLGHFALTAQLFEVLKKSAPSRIVSTSSFLHWYGKLVFDEDKLMVRNEKEHGQFETYTVSKLCLLIFTLELNRRLKAAGIEGVTAAAAHPGYCDTMIYRKATAMNRSSWYWWFTFRTSTALAVQSPQKGALPLLYAATGPNVKGGDYFGPKYLELYGRPVREEPSRVGKSETAAAKLWALSEEKTHLKFDVEA
jgi:NAD(P)-dependent dehydrogenase (short-subunit alcohol dehydrogenase family)